MDSRYIQCSLRKNIINASDTVHSSTVIMVSYIPKEHAVLGKELKIEINDEWEVGWVVTAVHLSSITDTPPDWRKSVRGHRSNTGDSLPKNDTNI